MSDVIDSADSVYVASSSLVKAGRGVFANRDIAAHELIEQAPVVPLLRYVDRRLLRFTELRDYYFQWGEERKQVAIALGFGSIYNHAYTPNAIYIKRINNNRIDFYALQPIARDEEIFVNYNGYPDDQRVLWTKNVPGPKADGLAA